jgi:hypothetical protein
MLTLDQFIATKKSTTWEEAAEILSIDKNYTTAPRALVYTDNFYIEDFNYKDFEHDNGMRGQYYLILGRDDWISDDLPYLEGLLYGYYVEENSEDYSTAQDIIAEQDATSKKED